MSTFVPESSSISQMLEENFWTWWSRLGKSEGCSLHDEGDALWFETPIPILPYNCVIRFSVDGDADRRLDRIFETYRRRGVPFVWIVHPSAKPDDLEHRLRARGSTRSKWSMGCG